MSEVVWTLPFPSSGTSGVDFHRLARRRCTLAFDDGESTGIRLSFEGVEAFKCTYHYACAVEMVETYDRRTDLGETQWLDSVRRQLSGTGGEIDSLRHLMIYVDDGPCYEFICRDCRAEEEAGI